MFTAALKYSAVVQMLETFYNLWHSDQTVVSELISRVQTSVDLLHINISTIHCGSSSLLPVISLKPQGRKLEYTKKSLLRISHSSNRVRLAV